MSISHFIREVLDILDFNITFYENQSEKQIGNYKKERIKDEICHVFWRCAFLCPWLLRKCGAVNDQTIIKWGFKTVMTQLNKVSEYKTYLRLKKQRFKCKACHQKFVASSTLTKPNCSIAQRVKLKIVTMLEDSVSMTYIAKQMAVAPMMVLRVLRDFYQPTLPKKQAFPTVLCLDEFKSGAFAEGAMSCILMDGEHTKLFDVLEDRKKDQHSNGFVEATNNHIKVIKGMDYGFRNFIKFKIRIFINRGKYFRTLPKKGKEKGQATKNAAWPKGSIQMITFSDCNYL